MKQILYLFSFFFCIQYCIEYNIDCNMSEIQATRHNIIHEKGYETGQYVDDVLKSVNSCKDNPVAVGFFSRRNIEILHSSIRMIIKEKVGVSIGRQNDNELILTMRGLYCIYANPGALCVADEIRRLNSICLEHIVPHIRTNVQHYLGYLRDISRPYTLLDRPENVSLRGSNTMEIKR